jgi:hypothetical protein
MQQESKVTDRFMDTESESRYQGIEHIPYQYSRLFLSQLQHLSYDHLKEFKIIMLQKSPALLRDLRGIDKLYSREIAKFAIIYVGLNQETENAILKNKSGSKIYREFVNTLGKVIDINAHVGYLGGLDATIVENVLYYSNATSEMVFHDVTMLKDDPSDIKQLKKKRHIGNDHVHIIWNEHYREYKWDTIGGDFGNVQICITPLQNGLFAIDIYKDDILDSFGPLQTKCLISKQHLGPFVRNTAMNAYKVAHSLEKSPDEPHPFTLRKQSISLVSERYGLKNDTYENMLGKILSDPMGR